MSKTRNIFNVNTQSNSKIIWRRLAEVAIMHYMTAHGSIKNERYNALHRQLITTLTNADADFIMNWLSNADFQPTRFEYALMLNVLEAPSVYYRKITKQTNSNINAFKGEKRIKQPQLPLHLLLSLLDGLTHVDYMIIDYSKFKNVNWN